MKRFKTLLWLLLLLVAASGLFVTSGIYDIGADAPHTKAVEWLLTALRERSIDSHADGIKVPPLDDPKLIAEGAEHYAAMCTDCHLAPGMAENELRPGLYPQPPLLYKQSGENPAEQFWVIKHGVKLTAMPAWGKTHDDDAIWGMVAFLQKLPSLSAEQYAQMTAHAEKEHEHHYEETAPKSGN